jgi:hypothetical protein
MAHCATSNDGECVMTSLQQQGMTNPLGAPAESPLKWSSQFAIYWDLAGILRSQTSRNGKGESHDCAAQPYHCPRFGPG